MNTMLKIAQERYTTKHYDPAQTISQEQIRDLLEILRLAPSSMNVQPWHFYIYGPESKEKLLPAVADFNKERVANASHVIIMAIESNIDDAWLDRIFEKEDQDGRFAKGVDFTWLKDFRRQGMALYQTGPDKGEIWAREQVNIALGFLMFAAAGMGIDTTAMGGMNFAMIDEMLDLKAVNRKAVIALTLGLRKDDSNAVRPKSRLDTQEVMTFL